MKLTIFGERTEGVEKFYEKIRKEGYVGSIKAIRLDEVFIGSEPSYAIRLKGTVRDCLWLFRKTFKGFPTNIKFGW